VRICFALAASLGCLGLAALPVAAERAASREKSPRQKQENLVKVSSEVSGLILVLGTAIQKDDEVPAEKVVTVKNIKYRRLAVGDRVKAGQIIARVDDQLAVRDLEVKKVKADAAEADHKVAALLLEEASARAKRDEQLRNRGAIAAEELATSVLTRDKYLAETQAKAAAARLAKLDVDLARAVVDMHELRSPVNGVIRRIYKTRGEGVRNLDAVILIEETPEK